MEKGVKNIVFIKIVVKTISVILQRIRLLFVYQVQSRLFSNNLNKLAVLYGTDKWGAHYYTQHYHNHFYQLRKKKLNILEIGVGGYADLAEGGQSLRMWKRYFPKSNIYSIDIYDKSALQEKRIKIFQGSQVDESFLTEICNRIGLLDIIIDDGSHINSHVITTFKILFPILRKNGIYAIEDTQTSYWSKKGNEEFGGDSADLTNPSTSLNFLKSLTDCLNYEEFLVPGYKPSYFDKHIVSIHFYHNLVIMHKGSNSEGSNMMINGGGPLNN